ncbi:GNAT family N-acetyltransferase [Kineococcus sp. R86509]|uniref:GNAT family N-acetyltransferase n=1 Tax=Kineococcus sp. R86509 TaxID=3093851 RepID=UPI0036D34ABC
MSEPLEAVTWPLHTERLLLRRATAADEDALWSYRRLVEVSRWGSWHAQDRADFHAILLPRLRDQLVVEHEGRVVGDLMVKVEDAWAQREVRDRGRDVQAELGWALAPAATGQGFATEAVREVIRTCFSDLGLRRVTANAFADNEASCRLAERVGMRRESYCVGESLHRDLGWVDSVGYALLASEWVGRTSGPAT